MELTVLGKSPSWEDAGGACSGYLVEHGGFRLLLECGNGVLAKLRRVCDYVEVDAVLITHLHGDHFLDLMPYSHALLLGPHPPRRPQLHVPIGGTEKLRRVSELWGDPDLVPTAFEVREYRAGAELRLGALHVRVRAVPHFTETFAADLRGEGEGRLTFSADCGPNDVVPDLARDTDLLLIEATLPAGEESEGHLNARQAGELGRRAGARRLVVTHFSDELDAEEIRREATAGFGRPVELAHEAAVYTV